MIPDAVVVNEWRLNNNDNSGFTVVQAGYTAVKWTVKDVAKVSKKGVITAKSKGTCYIYVIGVNGVQKKVKVAVK